jgi:hypothetical protein
VTGGRDEEEEEEEEKASVLFCVFRLGSVDGAEDAMPRAAFSL